MEGPARPARERASPAPGRLSHGSRLVEPHHVASACAGVRVSGAHDRPGGAPAARPVGARAPSRHHRPFLQRLPADSRRPAPCHQRGRSGLRIRRRSRLRGLDRRKDRMRQACLGAQAGSVRPAPPERAPGTPLRPVPALFPVFRLAMGSRPGGVARVGRNPASGHRSLPRPGALRLVRDLARRPGDLRLCGSVDGHGDGRAGHISELQVRLFPGAGDRRPGPARGARTRLLLYRRLHRVGRPGGDRARRSLAHGFAADALDRAGRDQPSTGGRNQVGVVGRDRAGAPGRSHAPGRELALGEPRGRLRRP